MTLQMQNALSDKISAEHQRECSFFFRNQRTRASEERLAVVVSILTVNRGELIPAYAIQLMVCEHASC